MNMPGFTAEAALTSPGLMYQAVPFANPAGADAVIPQLCACTPCVQVGGGKWCVKIPVINKKVCVNVPNVGRWKVCGCVKFGWPPFSFGLKAC